MKLYDKIISSIQKGLNESGLFDDGILDTDESTLDELNIADNITPYKFVDLGLPSGILWCDRNLGAKKPEDTGLYYQWGSIKGYDGTPIDGFIEYPLSDKNDIFTKYCFIKSKGVIDCKSILGPEDDAANVINPALHIPTIKEFQELGKNCDITYLAPGKAVFTSKINGNSITLPMGGMLVGVHNLAGKVTEKMFTSGYYWTCNLNTSLSPYKTIYAWMYYICYSKLIQASSKIDSRYHGMNIRPIIYKNK